MLDALAELADPDYQERVLGLAERPACNRRSPSCAETLFGDSGLGLALDRDVVVFGLETDRQLRTLAGMKVGKIEDQPFDRLIADPRFVACRRLAGAILARLTGTADRD